MDRMGQASKHISFTMTKEVEVLLDFLRVGLGIASPDGVVVPSGVDWTEVIRLARSQKVIGVFVDGLVKFPLGTVADRKVIMRAVGFANRDSNKYEHRYEVISEIAELWSRVGIRTQVLKGMSFARYYPNPQHRYSCDVDVYVSDFEKSNKVLKHVGLKVDETEQKHSRLSFKDVTIENHQHCCGQVGDERIMELDAFLITLLNEKSEGNIQDSKLEYTQLLFDALFSTYHARTHFLIEDGVKLSHLLDWILIRQQLAKRSLTQEFEAICDKYGMTKFLNAMSGVCDFVEGKLAFSNLGKAESLLFADIFTSVELAIISAKKDKKSNSKTESRLNLIKSIWNNRWKYPLYSDLTAYKVIINYIKGYAKRFV